MLQQRKNISTILGAIRNMGLDGFMLALLSAIGLAYLWPYPGTAQSPLHLSTVSMYGVSVVFFFYGLKLHPGKLRTGIGNWKLHMMVHLSTFVLFPLIALALHPLFHRLGEDTMWTGVFFLAVLPSTVSSSVVMVSIAQGNIPAAIFNASISSLLGVFLTPIWMGLVLGSTNAHFDLWPVVGKLAFQVLLPVALGVVLNRRWGRWAEKNRDRIKLLDQSSILLIVYTSFCASFGERLFSGLGLAELLLLGLGMMSLFWFVYLLLLGLTNLLGFNREDKIATLFCGSKKSLVQGAVMAKVLFAGPQAGLMLLPIMIYHALQLIMASALAQRMAQKHRLNI
ncbi:sodium/bile acid cotransporter 7 [Dyadobacter jejuensis]|uniref:Sodium/bile acid cotransporter 7 n=1 Tax=Dyadobacter jejuensis TaxID=1082580 RepID=A0A316APM4_9BACT|nr:bile acid:sodium symporter family protein [Dyadobacter jejuensis]PWJ59408.1 sodium/bile acid cotransporter 7 [Dyadobacter jejuensis]